MIYTSCSVQYTVADAVDTAGRDVILHTSYMTSLSLLVPTASVLPFIETARGVLR